MGSVLAGIFSARVRRALRYNKYLNKQMFSLTKLTKARINGNAAV